MFMFSEPGRSPYDLNFRVLKMWVRVTPAFWIFTGLIFANIASELGLLYWVLTIGCVFISILVHELGHALAYRYYGIQSGVVLTAMGGLAIPEGTPFRRSSRIICYLAGPGAQFLLLGILYATNRETGWAMASPVTFWLYSILVMINLYWPLINLLPVWPLDGGMVSKEICEMTAKHRGFELCLQISIAVGLFYAIYCLLVLAKVIPNDFFLPGGIMGMILFSIFAFNAYQHLQLQRRSRTRFWSEEKMPWE
jgi:stage IV sporulation protein FB